MGKLMRQCSKRLKTELCKLEKEGENQLEEQNEQFRLLESSAKVQ